MTASEVFLVSLLGVGVELLREDIYAGVMAVVLPEYTNFGGGASFASELTPLTTRLGVDCLPNVIDLASILFDLRLRLTSSRSVCVKWLESILTLSMFSLCDGEFLISATD